MIHRAPILTLALLGSLAATGCNQLGSKQMWPGLSANGPQSALDAARAREAEFAANPVRIESDEPSTAPPAATTTPAMKASMDDIAYRPISHNAKREYRGQTPGPGSAGDYYRNSMPDGSVRTAQGGAPPNFAPGNPGFAPGQGPPGAPGQGGPVTYGPSGEILRPNPYDIVDPVMDTAPAIPFDVFLEEERTGRFIFGVGVNSDAGLTGQIVIDEQNADWRAFPRSWQDIWDGYAFRGGGQRFRLEAMPGDQVQRYLVSLTEPYLFDTQVSGSASASYYDRAFVDWTEQRTGGRFSMGYRLSPDLSVSSAFRGERVKVRNPRVAGVPELDEVIGANNLYGFQGRIAHDTRDVPFAPTEGHLIEFTVEHVIGDFDYTRGELDYRQHYLIFERPDGSGRHTVSNLLRVGITGSQTPVFENYYAGGFSTLRGFDFRGASPISNGVIVGGEFRFLGSLEYMMPLTADDMLKGVVFCDYGTVEETPKFSSENFRVAVGTGLRISIPALGPAPLALDFAFPLAKADSDTEQQFSFFFGMGRS